MTASVRKARISAAFTRASATYDDHATLQRTAAAALATRIGVLDLPPTPHLLEIGCGTGLLTEALARALPDARALITDLSPAMVRACRARIAAPGFQFAAMDGEAPCVSATFDLICASLAVQWFEDFAGSLSALAGLLRPGGWLAVATLGPASLATWREAHTAEGLAAPTPDFADAAPLAAAWRGPAWIDRTTLTVTHASGRELLHSLRAIGADTPRAHHQKLSPGALRRVLARFERDHDATVHYQIVQLCLQAPYPA